MTREEKSCFQLGSCASAAGVPCAPCFDREMYRMVSEGRSERSAQRSKRNMSAWFMGYLHQYVRDGRLLNEAVFRGAMIGMFPSAKDGAIQPWIEFVNEITQRGQFVDPQKTDSEAAKAHWYDALLAGFYQLKAEYGEASAAKTLELGLENLCLYPYELEKAAEQVCQGTTPEKLAELSRDGLLETRAEPLPMLRDVLDWDSPRQSPQMNMNLS